MSKYTTEVRYICEVNAGLDESVGYNDVNTIIANSRAKIFDFSYPIFDSSYKSVLETKILKHYYTREIGAETVGLWKLWLNARMNEIMPYYNKLYESELIKFDPMKDYDLTKEGHRKGADNTVNSGTDKTQSQASGNDVVRTEGNGETATGTEYGGQDVTNVADAQKLNRWDMYSDTPQGDIIAMNNDEYRYLTNARHITEDGTGSTRNETKNYGQTVDVNGEYSDNTTETTTHGKKVEATTTHGKTIDATSTEEYLEHISGKISGVSYSKLLEEYRDTLLNIDMLVIRDLGDLFFNLW